MSKNKSRGKCVKCDKRGGRMQEDPYAAEIQDDHTKVRLHEECAREIAEDI